MRLAALLTAFVVLGCDEKSDKEMSQTPAPGADASDLERWSYFRCEREAACGFERDDCEGTQRLLQCGVAKGLKLDGLADCLDAMQTPDCDKRYEEPCNLVRSALLNYPDLVTVQAQPVDAAHSTLVIWSRSVYGRRDFDVNKQRTEAWLAAARQPNQR